MATKIVTKNSSTASAVPTTSDLVQGELAVNVADKRLYTEDNAGAIVELGTNPSTLTVTGEITANGGIALGDNDKATFGASDDLQIYHSGTGSYIDDAATGHLYIRTQGDGIYFQSIAGEQIAHFNVNGSNKFYYDNAEKLATTSTGIDVTGTATMDGLVVEPSSATGLTYAADGTNSYINFEANSISDSVQLYAGQSSGGFFSIGTKNSGGTLAERMRIDSSGSILFGSAGQGYISGTVANTYNSGYNQDDDSWATWMNYYGYQNGATRYRDFIVGNGKTGRIATFDGSSGNVGIGTSSPDTLLNLASSSAPTLRIENTDTSLSAEQVVGALEFFSNDPSGKGPNVTGYIETRAADGIGAGGTMVFATGATGNSPEGERAIERMRIDASGNLLVGTTSEGSWTTTAGFIARSNGVTTATVASDAVLHLNRKTSDGDIAVFRKDGTTVGSIGTVANRLAIGSGDVGIFFDDLNDRWVPITQTGLADRDAAIDLGYSSSRFKDAYLSGTLNGISTTKSASGNRWGVLPEVESNGVMEVGRYLDFHSTDGDTSDYGARLDFNGTDIVSTNAFQMSSGIYLGGTGAANKLDDYEEGTWTPAFQNIGNGTYVVQVGRYTKIGNLVTANFHLDIGVLGTASGALKINGLPFTSASITANYGSMTTAHASGWASDLACLGGLNNPNSTTFYIYYQNTSGVMAEATHAQMNVGNFLATIIYTAA